MNKLSLCLLKSVSFTLILFGFSISWAAGGKAMDCNECRESYADLSACTPICGGQAFKGEKSKKFYELLKTLGAETCGEEGCSAELSNTSCTWKNGKKRSNFECKFELPNGKTGSVQGPQAQNLTSEIERMGQITSDCGAGNCGFTDPQDIYCNADTEKNKPKKKIFVCRVSQIVTKPSVTDEPDGAVEPGKKEAGKK